MNHRVELIDVDVDRFGECVERARREVAHFE